MIEVDRRILRRVGRTSRRRWTGGRHRVVDVGGMMREVGWGRTDGTSNN